MSLLYKALRKSAEREQERPPADARVPLAPAVPVHKRRGGASRIVLLALLVVAAVGAGGLFLWPQVERALGPRTTATLLNTASAWLAELTGGPTQPRTAQPSTTQTAATQPDPQPRASQPAADETAAASAAATASGGTDETATAATAESGRADEAPVAGAAPQDAAATRAAEAEPGGAKAAAADEETYQAVAAAGEQQEAGTEAPGDPIPLAPSTEPGVEPTAESAPAGESEATPAAETTAPDAGTAASEGEATAAAGTAAPESEAAAAEAGMQPAGAADETATAAATPEPSQPERAAPAAARDGGAAAEAVPATRDDEAPAAETDAAPAQNAEAPGDAGQAAAMASIPGEEPLVTANEAAAILREIENPSPDRRTGTPHGDGGAGATQSAAHTGGAAVDGGASEVRIDRSLDSGDNAAVGRIDVVNETAPVMDRFHEAHRLMQAGRFGRALEVYEALVERMPRDRTALLGRASALQQLGRTQAAIAAYRAVLARHPEDIAALTNLVGLLGAGASESMIERLHRLYAGREDYAPAAAQLAMAYARMDQPAQAVALMRRAADLRPESLVYQSNLAILLDRAGQAREAVRAYERVLALAATAEAGRVPVPVESMRERLRYLGMN